MYGTQVTFYGCPLICQNFILDLDMDMGALSRNINRLNFFKNLFLIRRFSWWVDGHLYFLHQFFF